MKKTILVFSGLIIALLLLFRLSAYVLIPNDFKIEIIIAIIAIVFFIIGVYINKRSLNVAKTPSNEIDQDKIKSLDISEREYQVLEYVSEGLSNKEIADKLYLSESTIKTHVSNLLVKLNAKRRTQAVQIAKSLQIL